MKRLYLVLCILGFVLPYSQFIPFLLDNGLNLSLFFEQLFANRIGVFFAVDVVVSAVVLLAFVFAEGRRLGMRLLWVPVVATFTVGVSLGLPAFLYLRQHHLEQAKPAARL